VHTNQGPCSDSVQHQAKYLCCQEQDVLQKTIAM